MKEIKYSLHTRKVLFTLFTLLLCWFSADAQLKTPERTELFRDDVVSRVDIAIDQESLDYILDPANRDSDELFEAQFIFSNDVVRDTLENIGFRLRGNTSRSAQKKSFKIDINEFVPGRRFYGVTKINLNGQHNDPSSARAKICADLADRIGIPSLRSSHVELYINGEYFGLYTNVEHIDQNYAKKRFGNKNGNLYKCLYPADLAYKGDNPDAYKEVIFGRRNYDLKSNTETDDYSDIAKFIKVLNLSSDADFPCEIEKIFNVDTYLKFIIFDILTGNWDGPIYNKNNFYLYQNQATGKFEYIPFDLDNTLGIDWLNKDWGNRDIYTWAHDSEPRPLFKRFMDNQEYRDRFSLYLQEILLNLFNEAELYPYLDNLKDQLKPYIENDVYYTKDYGFDVGHFEDAFDFNTPFFQTDYGLKAYIQTRLIASFNQLELNDIKPVITYPRNNYPNETENVIILANIFDDGGIAKAEVCYSISGGAEICHTLLDDGTQNDGEANDGLYGATLPPMNALGEISYRIEVEDNIGQTSTLPRCGDITFSIEEQDLKLSINEFMASNSSTIDDIAGEYNDWIELYNYGTNPIYLGDKFLSDNPENVDKWAMPNYTIQGGEYLLFWADDDRNQGSFHTNFKLSKSGEYIGVFDDENSAASLIDEIEFGNQTTDVSVGRLPNGTGDFVSLQPSPGAPNVLTSTNEINDIHVILSPNPTFDFVIIEANEKITQLRLFDGMGRMVHNFNWTENVLELPQESGIYFVLIGMESKKSVVRKIIKIE